MKKVIGTIEGLINVQVVIFKNMNYNPENPQDLAIIEQFENEINIWFNLNPNKSFEDYLIQKECILDNNTVLQRNLSLYKELIQKWSGLQELRWMRKQKPEKLQTIKELSNKFIKQDEINVARINF